MADLDRKCDYLLETISSKSSNASVFPPPIIDPKKLIEPLKKNRNRPSNRKITGYGLLQFFVSLHGENISVLDPLAIKKVTYLLWKNSTSRQKSDYILLAKSVDNQLRVLPVTMVHSATTDPMDIRSTTVDTMDADTTTVDTMDADTTTVNSIDVETTTVNSTDVETTTVNSTDVETATVNSMDVETTTVNSMNIETITTDDEEKPGETNEQLQQKNSALLDVYKGVFKDFLLKFEEYEWSRVPEHVQHFNYQGIIKKSVKPTQVKQLENYIKLNMKDNSKVWYHGTNSIYAASIAQGIDLTVSNHFGHAFGFHRSFYIGDNLKYCLTSALKAAGTRVNCAVVVFSVNEKELCEFQHLKLIDDDWKKVVQDSKNSSSKNNILDNDPIPQNVHWVEGENLGNSNDNNGWTPKKDDIIRSFRTDESARFLHSQLAFIITFKNPFKEDS